MKKRIVVLLLTMAIGLIVVIAAQGQGVEKKHKIFLPIVWGSLRWKLYHSFENYRSFVYYQIRSLKNA